MYPLRTHPARCAPAAFCVRSGFFVIGLTKRKSEDPVRDRPLHRHFRSRFSVLEPPEAFAGDVTSLTQVRAAFALPFPACSQYTGGVQCPIFPRRSITSKPTS